MREWLAEGSAVLFYSPMTPIPGTWHTIETCKNCVEWNERTFAFALFEILYDVRKKSLFLHEPIFSFIKMAERNILIAGYFENDWDNEYICTEKCIISLRDVSVLTFSNILRY